MVLGFSLPFPFGASLGIMLEESWSSQVRLVDEEKIHGTVTNTTGRAKCIPPIEWADRIVIRGVEEISGEGFWAEIRAAAAGGYNVVYALDIPWSFA